MRFLRLFSFAIICVIVLCVAVAPAKAETYNYRANTVGNKDSIAYVGLEKFKTLIESRTDGVIKVKLFDSGALGDQVSGIESMQSGTLAIATVETPITTVDNLLGVTALPYIFRDPEHVKLVMDGPVGLFIKERLDAKGLHVLGYMESGFRQITNNKRPIYKPSDLKGIKIRTPDSKLRVKIFNTYGANASPLPFNELYSALQTGVFDAQENPVIWVKSTKFYEVQDYLSITNHLYTVTYLLMSKEKYQQLPEGLQLMIDQAGADAAAYTLDLGRKSETEIIDFLKAKGMKINNADTAAFQNASLPLWDEWAAEQNDPKLAKQLIKTIQTAGTDQ